MQALALQTVLEQKELLYFSWEKNIGLNILKQATWNSLHAEFSEVFEQLEQLLPKPFPKLDAIFCATGLGPFSSTRLGVTIANTLTVEDQIPLYDFLIHSPEHHFTADLLIGEKPFWQTSAADYQNLPKFLAEILKNPLPTGKNLLQPIYSKPPNITPSKKPQFF
jgi:tRNA A37 threonylcarbamoyladenosine modification protein TsaB